MIDQYGEMRQEVMDRGFHHVGATRCGKFVQEAAAELHTLELWDFRRAVVTGAAPLAIEAGALVKQVRDTSTREKLWPVSESRALDEIAISSATPREYFIEGGDSLRTHPDSTTNLTVVIYGVLPWETGGQEPANDNDTPKVPIGWRDIIKEKAVAKALRDDGREDEAIALEAEPGGLISRRLEEMRGALLRQAQADEPRYIRPESVW